ncbi:MAG TPA: cobamide remodeling phosphodiesterase CbiR [Candidatus Baltobacteraceae bacterium]|nr:cobamide remodeling phosphodiesterase CbiR [Candidatus Baltobacteraceae bacterium]
MFRIGTTSYILPAGILANVEYLAPLVDDIELVLFETDEHGSNLPDAALCRRLQEIAVERSLSYTVHLPLDVLPGAGPGADCLEKARRAIDATHELAPYAYVVHLDGRPLMARTMAADTWRDGAVASLEAICRWIGAPQLLCVENVEGWDPAHFAPVLERLAVSRAADVGHLWLQGQDPRAVLPDWIERTRVVHLHGIAARDHESLSHVPAGGLDPLVELLSDRFDGVVTLEVFNEQDFMGSMAALRDSLRRVRKGGESCRVR